MNKNACAIIVRNPGAGYEEIRQKVDSAIRRGRTRFLSGMEYGAGLTAAEYVLSCKEGFPEITLECVIPLEEYTTVWDEASRERYFAVLSRCDTETMLQRSFAADCLHRQREYLLRHSEETIII